MKPAYIFVGVIALVLFSAVIYVRLPKGASMSANVQGSDQEEVTKEEVQQPRPPDMEIDVNKPYKAILETTQGTIVIRLHAKETPRTVNNFVHLARAKFYDNTIFHRVISGFMIQGGDPRGNGTGGPGYRFDDEPFTGEYVRGTVAMANAGPNTNGSQFFIMHKDYPLDKQYVIFGEVIEGLDVVDKIATAETTMNGLEKSKPVTPVTVKTVMITDAP